MTETLHYKAETTSLPLHTDNNYFVQIDTGMVFSIIIVRLHLA